MSKLKQSLPEIFEKNWIPSENNPELFVSVFASPDFNKPMGLTEPQLKFIKAMLSGNYLEGWFAGGNSAGKTWAAKFMAMMFGCHKIRPGKKKFATMEEYSMAPYNILCTGPENKQALELLIAIEDGFKNSPLLMHKVVEVRSGTKKEIHPYIRLDNGVKIEAIGLHEKGKHIEGQAYDLVLINEPADAKHLIECWERVLFPRTWRRGGLICGFGTPKGKGEYYNLWRRGQEFLDDLPNQYYEPQVYSQYADSRTNKFADQDTIVRALDGKSEEYIRERVEGRFTDNTAAALKDSDIDMVIDTELKNPIAPSTYHQYIHGVDFGRLGDYTAIITWDVSVIPHIQVNTYRAGGGAVSWENIFEDLMKIYRRYGGELIVDATGMGADMQMEWLNDLGIPYIPYQFAGSPGKKIALVNNLQDFVEKRKFRMPYDEQLLEEMRIYPANMDDKSIPTDMFFALALVAWGARNYEPLPPIEVLRK